MGWVELFNYESEADVYLRIEKEREESAKRMNSLKKSSWYQAQLPEAREANAFRETDLGMAGYDQEQQYIFNREAFFSGLKEPDFEKVEVVKGVKPKREFGTQISMMNATPLPQPMKVYKFKTVDQETGASVITSQKEFTVYAENEHNYYYLTKDGIQSVAKNETSMQKLDPKDLRNRFVQQMNKTAQKIVQTRSQGANFAVDENAVVADRTLGEKVGDFAKEGLARLMGPTTTKKDIDEGLDNLKSAAYGFADVLSEPLQWVGDKIIQGGSGDTGYAHDPEYFKKVEVTLNELKTKEGQKKLEYFDKKKKYETEKYPKGYSEETDAMARGDSKEKIAEARAVDQKKTYNAFMGRDPNEELSKSESVSKVAGEIAGTLTEMIALGQVAGVASTAAKAKWLKKAVQVVVTGGGYGFLEKLKERDAEAMDYLKSMVKETAFFAAGGAASEKVGKLMGPAKSLKGEIAKLGAKGAAFGAAGSAATMPFKTKEERNIKNLGTDVLTGMAFDIGMGMLSKAGGGRKIGQALEGRKVYPTGESRPISEIRGKTIKPAPKPAKPLSVSDISGKKLSPKTASIKSELNKGTVVDYMSKRTKQRKLDQGYEIKELTPAQKEYLVSKGKKGKYLLTKLGEVKTEQPIAPKTIKGKLPEGKTAKVKSLKVEPPEILTPKSRKEFDAKFGLDKSTKGMTKKERYRTTVEATKKIINEIGEKIITRTGTKEPKGILNFYNNKYKLSDKTISIRKDLRGINNYARLEERDGNLELLINPDKTETEIAAAIRHEVEHAIDLKAGHVMPKDKFPQGKTVRELMSRKGHHSKYDNFEIEYLQKIYKSEGNEMATKLNDRLSKIEATLNTSKTLGQKTKTSLQAEKQRIETTLAKRMAFSTPPETEVPWRNEKVVANNRTFTEATNLPVYEPPRKTMKGKAQNFIEEIDTKFFNRHRAFDARGENVKITAQNYHKHHTTAEYIITNALVTRDGKRLGKSVKDIIVAPKGLQVEFESYLNHVHHVDRMYQGKPLLAGPDGKPLSVPRTKEIIANYEKVYPQFKERKADVQQFFSDFTREWYVDGGLLTKKEFKSMRQLYKDFVPGYRDLDYSGVSTPVESVGGSSLKRAKGGKEPLLPLTQSIPMYVEKGIRDQRRNMVHTELINAVLKDPVKMQPYLEIYKVDKNTKKSIIEKLKEYGGGNMVDVETKFNAISELLIHDQPTKGKFMIALDKGKPIVAKVNDKALWNALTKLQASEISAGDQMLNLFNKHVTSKFKGALTVYNPFFALRNFARDVPTAYIQGSQHNPVSYVKNLGANFIDIVTSKPLYKQYQALGGFGSNITKSEQGLIQTKKSAKFADTALRLLNTLGRVSEDLSRYGEFKYVLEKGKKAGEPMEQLIQKALFKSGEVTVNFSRGGEFTKRADVLFPYLNAGTQGFNKTYRSLISEGVAKGNWAPLIKSLGVATLPSVALAWMNQSRDWGYENIPDYVKDQNYIIPVTEKNYIKIPKTRESAFIFGTVFERMYRHFVEKDPKAFDGLMDSAKRMIFNPIEEVAGGGIGWPLFNIKGGGNKDFFGRPIEPLSAGMSNLSKEYITKADTSKASRLLAPFMAKAFKISPAQTDYLIKSYAGVVGEAVLQMNDKDETLLEKFRTMTHLTYQDTGYKKISDSYADKDQAKQDLADFEYTSGIDSLQKQLKDEGVTSRTEIEEAITNMLDWDQLSEWQELKDRKKELEEDDY